MRSEQSLSATHTSEADGSIKCWFISIVGVSELFEAPNRAIAEKHAEARLRALDWGDLTDISCEAFVQEWDLDTNKAAHGSEVSAVSIDLPPAPEPISAVNTARCYGCGQTREVRSGEVYSLSSTRRETADFCWDCKETGERLARKRWLAGGAVVLVAILATIVENALPH